MYNRLSCKSVPAPRPGLADSARRRRELRPVRMAVDLDRQTDRQIDKIIHIYVSLFLSLSLYIYNYIIYLSLFLSLSLSIYLYIYIYIYSIHTDKCVPECGRLPGFLSVALPPCRAVCCLVAVQDIGHEAGGRARGYRLNMATWQQTLGCSAEIRFAASAAHHLPQARGLCSCRLGEGPG